MLFTVNACTTVKSTDINDYIGLYQVTESDCHDGKSSYGACENILFLEILKGQFIGVENSELAYVFWSGYPKIDSELQYTSHNLNFQSSQLISDDVFWLNQSSEIQEYLVFLDGTLKKFHLKYKAGATGEERIIEYSLRSVRRGSFPFVRMNYPGN